MYECSSEVQLLNPYTTCLVCLKTFVSYDGSIICAKCKEKGFEEN